MYDLSYAIPSLLLLSLFVGYFFLLPRVPNRMNHTFFMLLLVEVSTIVLNLISSWVDMYYMDYSKEIVAISNALFFCMFYLRGYMFFLFTLSAVKVEEYYTGAFGFLKRIPLQLCMLLAITSPWTHYIFWIGDDGYHSGPYYMVLYLEFWMYILLSVLIILINKNMIQRREKISLLWCNAILFLGTLFRLFLPQILMMNTFCVIAVTILYLSFENPDFYLERRSKVFNSRALRDYIEEVNGKKPYRILSFVIHNYRDIRDIYGARQMNEGIDMIGSYLRETFPKVMVFYYSSGRFALIAGEELELESEKIRHIIEERFDSPWISDNAELYLDVSMVYINPGNKVQSADVVFNALTESLSQLSRAGSESFVTLGEKEIRDTEKGTVVKRNLEAAIDNDLVEAFLQPIVEAKTHKIVGAEALARIRDSEGKLIPPGLFIPIAERNGSINQLGEQVLDKVCKFIAENDIKKMGLNWINVNLSPIQFMRQDLSQRLTSIISRREINPAYIHLEVTEESMIDDILLLKQIKSIQESGFYFVLDDYGSGYSNLARLRRCPFINVKIDMSLVWEYIKCPDEMLPNMVSTFKNLGFSITAEGIEDEGMAKMMADIGCDYLQGYYFDKALTMDEFIAKYS